VFRVPIEELLEPANRFTVRHPLGWNGPGWMIGPDRDVLLWGFTAGVIHALLDFVGWTREWDRSVERPLPEQHVDWTRIAKELGIEIPEGRPFDPVEAGLIPDPFDAGEPPSPDVDREHRR
jgi:hypothetical protein